MVQSFWSSKDCQRNYEFGLKIDYTSKNIPHGVWVKTIHTEAEKCKVNHGKLYELYRTDRVTKHQPLKRQNRNPH
jgi:hypothetical protein